MASHQLAERRASDLADFTMRAMTLPTDIAYKRASIKHWKSLRDQPRTDEYTGLVDGVPHKIITDLDTGESWISPYPTGPKLGAKVSERSLEKISDKDVLWEKPSEEYPEGRIIKEFPPGAVDKKMGLGEAVRLATTLTKSELEPILFPGDEEEYGHQYAKLFYKNLKAFIPEEEIPEELRPSKNFFQKLAGFLSSKAGMPNIPKTEVKTPISETDLLANINDYETLEELREALGAAGAKMSPMREEGKEVWVLPSGKKVRF